MTLRRLLLPVSVIACLAGVTTLARPAGPAAPLQDPAAMSDPLAAPAVPPDQKALNAAMKIPSIADRVAALDQLRTDFPASSLLDTVELQMLAGVLQMPDPTDSADEVLTRILARIPSNATPDVRFRMTAVPVAFLVSKKVLLERSEKLLTTAAAALDLEAYVSASLADARKEMRPEPGRASLEAAFNRDYRARSHFELGRLQAAKGDVDRAEVEYKAAAAWYGPAVTELVKLYVDRNDKAKAEAFLLDVVKGTPVNPTALTSLVAMYRAEPSRAEAVLKDAVGRDPMLPSALLPLARIEQQRGDERAALDHYLQAGALTFLRPPDGDALKNLYAKVNGSGAGLDAELDKRYLAMPKAITPDRYTPPAGRGSRLVLLEMFTGSACPPCVAADLAFDAALDRYPADVIVPIAYHQHIPGPDPMATSEGAARRGFYNVTGVPTFFVDGVMAANPATGDNYGGGGRARAPEVYGKYLGMIDGALSSPAAAALAVRASMAADAVSVSVDVSELPAGVSDLRLHIVLAERELMFGGENGVRKHTMVVRGIAGADGQGLALSGNGTTKHTFDLAAIRTDITRSLQMDIARRRAGNGANAVFAAEDRPMTKFSSANLTVVAFVQAGRKVLQAARIDVVTPAPGK